MKIILFTFLALGSLAATNSWAKTVEDIEETQLNCEDPQTQVEINMCAWKEVTDLRKPWVDSIRAARKRIRDGAESEDTKKLLMSALRRSHAGFKIYLSAQCDLEALDDSGTGSLASAVRAGCTASLVKQRIDFLNNLQNWVR